MGLIRLAEMWEENQESLKQALGTSESDQFGARWVLMPYVPYPRFNHVSCIRVGEDEVAELLASARRFFRDQSLPYTSFLTTPATRPGNLAVQLYRLGYVAETNPVMFWDGSTPPRWERPGLEVARIERKDAPLFWELMRTVFFPGASPEGLAAGWRGVELSFDLGAFNYVAFLRGRPVGAGTLYITGEMGGIYNMCTLPQARRAGVATAILSECLLDAIAAGCEQVGLTPTYMGRPLYEKLGFQERYEELYFSQRIETGR